MKKHVLILYLTVITAAVLLSALPSNSQGLAREGTTAPSPAGAAPAQEAAQKNELSIYGEVQAVNIQTNSITALYYDYDNDEEKSIEITLGKDTKLENIKTIDELKKGDWVDVAYVVSGGKNIAGLISVEKEEPAQEENAMGAAAEE
jgi:hypothetical protein